MPWSRAELGLEWLNEREMRAWTECVHAHVQELLLAIRHGNSRCFQSWDSVKGRGHLEGSSYRVRTGTKTSVWKGCSNAFVVSVLLMRLRNDCSGTR